jgi:hypothetical protein
MLIELPTRASAVCPTVAMIYANIYDIMLNENSSQWNFILPFKLIVGARRNLLFWWKLFELLELLLTSSNLLFVTKKYYYFKVPYVSCDLHDVITWAELSNVWKRNKKYTAKKMHCKNLITKEEFLKNMAKKHTMPWVRRIVLHLGGMYLMYIYYRFECAWKLFKLNSYSSNWDLWIVDRCRWRQVTFETDCKNTYCRVGLLANCSCCHFNVSRGKFERWNVIRTMICDCSAAEMINIAFIRWPCATVKDAQTWSSGRKSNVHIIMCLLMNINEQPLNDRWGHLLSRWTFRSYVLLSFGCEDFLSGYI